jgi:hypothetical protein
MRLNLSKTTLIGPLRTQLIKIDDFCRIYDGGNELIVQEISVRLRILFDNSNKSKSLLKELRLENIPFVDTGKKYMVNNLTSHWGLICAESDL